MGDYINFTKFNTRYRGPRESEKISLNRHQAKRSMSNLYKIYFSHEEDLKITQNEIEAKYKKILDMIEQLELKVSDVERSLEI